MLRTFGSLSVFCYLFAFAVSSSIAQASECSTVISNAFETPSPNWTGNPYPGACYVDFPGGYQAERTRYERECRQIPGFLDFLGDRGSNRNTCIFRAPERSTYSSSRGSNQQNSQSPRITPVLPVTPSLPRLRAPDRQPTYESPGGDQTACISSSRSAMKLGYIDWVVINSCSHNVTFDYDECDPDPASMQPVCKPATNTISHNSEFRGSNYHLPARARNYR